MTGLCLLTANPTLLSHHEVDVNFHIPHSSYTKDEKSIQKYSSILRKRNCLISEQFFWHSTLEKWTGFDLVKKHPVIKWHLRQILTYFGGHEILNYWVILMETWTIISEVNGQNLIVIFWFNNSITNWQHFIVSNGNSDGNWNCNFLWNSNRVRTNSIKIGRSISIKMAETYW